MSVDPSAKLDESLESGLRRVLFFCRVMQIIDELVELRERGIEPACGRPVTISDFVRGDGSVTS
jgi:hypothetical protein